MNLLHVYNMLLVQRVHRPLFFRLSVVVRILFPPIRYSINQKSLTYYSNKSKSSKYLNSGRIDVEFLENSERLFVQLIIDSDISDIRSVIIIQSVYVLHYSRTICFDGR